MVKKFILVLVILLSLGCSKKVKEEYDDKDITVNIIDGTLNENGLILSVINNSDNDILLKPGFDVEKDVNGKFEKISKNKKCSSGIGYGIEKNNSMNVKVDWSCEYGKLESGKYHLIKFLENDEYLVIDFQL